MTDSVLRVLIDTPSDTGPGFHLDFPDGFSYETNDGSLCVYDENEMIAAEFAKDQWVCVYAPALEAKRKAPVFSIVPQPPKDWSSPQLPREPQG